MRKNNILILYSLFLIPLIAVVLFLDLSAVFNYSDTPFIIGFLLYGIIAIIQKSSSKMTFSLIFALLLYMGISYLPTGPSRTTERIGEWFYVFFVFGLIQYIQEVWFPKKR